MKRFKLRTLALALAGLPLLAGCAEDDATPLLPTVGGELFARYVALGNSITAGYQSGGIIAPLQDDAYPVLLAAWAGQEEFNAPLLSGPGCPQPFTAPLRPAPAAPAGAPCFRLGNPRIINNLAVPGVRIRELISFSADPRLLGLQTLMLGNRTQVQAMMDADPTLVSVWIGNNDALSASLSGNLGPVVAGGDSTLTPLSTFTGSLAQLVDSIDAVINPTADQPEDAILIGVVNGLFAPAIQPGAYYFAIRDQIKQFFPNVTVGLSCAPYGPTGQPNPTAFRNQISFSAISTLAAQAAAAGQGFEISCADQVPYVLNAAERQILNNRIAAYNAAIKQAADQRGWIYVDPETDLLGTVANDPSKLRLCQALDPENPPAFDPQFRNFGAAVLATCPVDFSSPNVFGSFVSLDAVHPSAAAHAFIAGVLAQKLNAKHGLGLPTS